VGNHMTEQEIRLKLFDWLSMKSMLNGGVFSWKQLAVGFTIDGKTITLVGPRGIWTPAGFSMPISITSAPHGRYPDKFIEDEVLLYKYMGNNPDHHDNIGLRKLLKEPTPFVYFHGIRPDKYAAVFPVFVVEDIPSELAVRVSVNPVFMVPKEGENLGIRRYIYVSIKQRLHQAEFREDVLEAYNTRCTLCNLQHVELLEAAHIIPDSEPEGKPIVPNGLSLCKIHHAAYDNNIIGISPDYFVKVREDVLEEIDGPMLKYGLQAMEGREIILPRQKKDLPDRDRLDIRYKRFLSA
jgi:putative restriction endonuclease